MGKHTPGPWTHYDDTTPAGKTGRHEIAAMGRTVARIYATKGLEADDLANARLIAAAPDLLAALKSACLLIDTLTNRLAECDAPCGGMDEVLLATTHDDARAAIAKAKGE